MRRPVRSPGIRLNRLSANGLSSVDFLHPTGCGAMLQIASVHLCSVDLHYGVLSRVIQTEADRLTTGAHPPAAGVLPPAALKRVPVEGSEPFCHSIELQSRYSQSLRPLRLDSHPTALVESTSSLILS